MRILWLSVLFLCIAASPAATTGQQRATAFETGPAILAKALHSVSLPRWLRVSGELRTRAEAPTGMEFREGGDQTDLLTRLRIGVLLATRS
jgi:hypothetical protein